MKKQFIIGNWKSNKTGPEAREWLEEYQISNIKYPISNDNNEIILCPPFPLLPVCHNFIQQHHLSLVLGSQDISQFSEGSYTGLVSGKLLKEFVSYAIIGHSETRKYLHETLDTLQQKVIQALSVGITPIYCVSDRQEKIPQGVQVVAFEPLTAIGSGNPENPDEVEAVARYIKQKNSVLYVLYGGSVTAQNVSQYSGLTSIDGVLVGGASLSPDTFTNIIHHA